ncbi:leucine-rich repeat protein [Prevotella sp. P6B4]|uniref:leucine-rich repeat protein n=1 Tax=Prevotella sp. P6B4 TaxID=1410614 RepID=UPI000491CFE5|nr:leucine-rich repeat protein [Prevotella sp. P6B4]
MRRLLLMMAVVCSVSTFGQDFFEHKCPDGQKLTFRRTSPTTVEVARNVRKPYDYTYVVIPGDITVKGVTYTVTSIGDAFQDYTWLKGVEIPNTVTAIGNMAFKGCTGLTKIVIPSSVKVIGKWAFEFCTMLKSVDIPNSVIEIQDFAFEGCTTLKSVRLAPSVMTLGRGAFRYCNKLANFEGLRSDIKLGEDVFFQCAFSTDVKEKEGNEFELAARRYIMPKLKEWQKKREFETTAQYQARITKDNQDKKTKELMAEAIKDYTRKNSLTPKLGAYDADYQLYAIETNYGKQYVQVSLDDAPAFKSRFATATLDGDYVATVDGLKLVALRVKVNGKQYQSIAMNEDTASASVDIELPEISLPVVSNAPEKNKKQTKPVVANADLTIDTEIPTTDAVNNNTFVVVIGNEKYQKVSEVPFASNDAKTVAAYCQRTLGIPAQNIRKYDNVTFGTMLSAISDIKSIADAYEGNLNVIFYYAGHGVPDEATLDAYLLPVDADGRYVEACYPVSRLYKELGELGAKSVVVFMDACFSGTKRGKGMLMAARGVAIKAKSQMPRGNMVVFSAATGDETAYPYKEKGHGLFTYFLLKKLQESRGDCTLGELSEFVRQNVRQQSIIVNRKSQTPTIQTSTTLQADWEHLKLK